MQYDPTIIEEFARRLLKRTRGTVVLWALGGALVGAMTGVSADEGNLSLIGSLLVIGAFLGALLGKDRAFKYKLEAQTALCQASIEANTRSVATAVHGRSASEAA